MSRHNGFHANSCSSFDIDEAQQWEQEEAAKAKNAVTYGMRSPKTIVSDIAKLLKNCRVSNGTASPWSSCKNGCKSMLRSVFHPT
jgi:hypothetical protein